MTVVPIIIPCHILCLHNNNVDNIVSTIAQMDGRDVMGIEGLVQMWHPQGGGEEAKHRIGAP